MYSPVCDMQSERILYLCNAISVETKMAFSIIAKFRQIWRKFAEFIFFAKHLEQIVQTFPFLQIYSDL
jgi:hypothetical protein